MPDPAPHAANAADEINRSSRKEAGDAAYLPAPQQAAREGVWALLEKGQLVDVIHHQDLRAVQGGCGVPATQVTVIHDRRLTPNAGGVVNSVRPGVGGLERQPFPEGVPKVRLQRVVVGDGGVLLHRDVAVAAIRHEKNVRQAVHQKSLNIAVSRRIAPGEAGKFRRQHRLHADGHLVDLPTARQVAAQAAHIAHAQEVVARKLVLNSQAELLYTSPFGTGRNRHEGGGTQRTGNDVVEADDVVPRGGERHRGTALRAFCVGFVTVSYLEINTITAAEDSLAVPRGVKSKTKARRQSPVVGLSTAGRNPPPAAFHQPISIRRVVVDVPRSRIEHELATGIQQGFLRRIIETRDEPRVHRGL